MLFSNHASHPVSFTGDLPCASSGLIRVGSTSRFPIAPGRRERALRRVPLFFLFTDMLCFTRSSGGLSTLARHLRPKRPSRAREASAPAPTRSGCQPERVGFFSTTQARQAAGIDLDGQTSRRSICLRSRAVFQAAGSFDAGPAAIEFDQATRTEAVAAVM